MRGWRLMLERVVSRLVAMAGAEDKRQVAEIPASGIIFKDTINVEAFRDPKVRTHILDRGSSQLLGPR
jgi:catabolite regulation protein CreA